MRCPGRHLALCVLLAVGVLLAGCVAAPALPTAAKLPTARTFLSPVAVTHELYFPLASFTANPKRGATLACGGDLAAQVRTLRAAWIWNWGTQPPLFPGVESVPNIWDARSIGAPLGGNSQWLLGFNEPDGGDQANLTPEEGARLWAQIEAAYPDRKLASPQVMHHHLRWLERFRAAYIAQQGHPPKLDAIALHTYYGNSAADYIAQVQFYIGLARAWGVPEVWVTEFALAPVWDRTLRATVAELRTYLDFLDGEPMVTRYAAWTNRVECMNGAFGFEYDGIFDTPLFHPDGSVSVLGQVYGGR